MIIVQYLYYPGCTLKTSAVNLEATAFQIMEALGHEMVEMEEWNCCGVVSSLTDDDLMHHLAPLRNLVHAEDQGFERIITLCDMCANTLKQTNIRVNESEEDLEKLNSFMDRENDYKKTVRVQHFLEFIRDDVGWKVLKKKLKKPLKGMKIMPYYGCTLLRPREVAIDDAEEPRVLADLIKTLGGECIDNPFKIECCGSHHTIDDKELTSRRAYKISKYALDKGADAIMLSCPLCRFNLDVRGKEAEDMFTGYQQIPVFYYTQLVAIALGLDIEPSDLAGHAVDPEQLLKDKEIVSA